MSQPLLQGCLKRGLAADVLAQAVGGAGGFRIAVRMQPGGGTGGQGLGRGEVVDVAGLQALA